MERLFLKREIYKAYLAIVDGSLNSPSGKISNFLAKKGSYAGQSIWGAVKKGGLRAVTVWHCLKKTKQASLLLCEPETGRTHQLRAHFAEFGHPILGDLQYAKKFRCPYRARRQLLHAQRLTFIHPITGKKLDCFAPLPEDFCLAQIALKLEIQGGDFPA